MSKESILLKHLFGDNMNFTDKEKDITIELRERFCKDTGIPINLNEEPYFSQRLEYLDKVLPHKNYMQKWKNYLEMLKDFNSDQDYFEYYNKVKDEAINYIKSSEGYNRFNQEDMNKYKTDIKDTHKNLAKSIYQEAYADGKTYISIDICSANFNCLRKYDNSIFDGANTWQEFLSKFTKYQHILDSKYIRQVILGNCNPSRVITYETYIASHICRLVEDYIPNAKLICFTTDEVIFDIPKEDRQKLLEVSLELTKHDIETKIDIFSLTKIDRDFQGYIRCLYNDLENGIYSASEVKDYKCLEGNFAYLIIKRLKNDDITEDDLVFRVDKHLCRLLKAPNLEVK